MAKTRWENTVFSGSERVPIVWIALPDELAKWVDQNQELVGRVQSALASTYDALTEEQLWGVIAASCSPEWQDAREKLQKAEDRWEDLSSPEKTSLGPIGNALDSDENNAAKTQYDFSLAYFTIVNEGLRQREDLGKLLKVMLVQKRMLERAAEQTQQTQKATAQLSALPLTAQDSAFAGVRAKRNLRDSFRQYADKVLKREKEQRPKTAPVPSSPKI
jgi:hypothetical protein